RKMEKPIWIAVDEWNVWYGTGPDLSLFYTLRDALADAIFVHVLQRHCNSVKMACLAQMVNVIAAIMANPEMCFRQTIYWPLWLAANVAGDTLIDAWADVESWSVDFIPGACFPFLDTVATLDEAGERVVVSVVNCHPSQEIEAEIVVAGPQITDDGYARTLTSDSPDDKNTFEHPDAVRLVGGEILGGNRIVHTFPAHSLTVIELEIL
ncbi:MAG: hypothetical protein H5T86_10455, partial [Armatimonadetes bacterium]|nr:hypothetical protein [Armatimonadota bacterium]